MLTNLDLLRRVPLFSPLTPAQAEALQGAVVKRRLRRGEVLVQEGHTSQALFLLLNGRARVVKTDARGREVILATLGPGDHIGEMSIIDNEPHSATVRAEVQTDVLLLGRTEFVRCLADNTSMALVLMRGLVKRLRHADRKIESLALLDVYGRVAHALLDMATEDPQGRPWIRERISRQDLAKMVGASREMVSRVMKDLEERGFIENIEGGGTLLKDRLHTL
ncbi:MAG: Crp/Fnr family transcriptional regulator [Burkholderiaceae bacterium]